MKIKYKQVKTLQPHCGDCGEQIQGNGSMVLPYTCSCGEWLFDLAEEEYVPFYEKDPDFITTKK